MSNPEIIYNVSYTQLSIARYYGGIKYNGDHYEYNPSNDTLIKRKKPEKEKKDGGKNNSLPLI